MTKVGFALIAVWTAGLTAAGALAYELRGPSHSAPLTQTVPLTFPVQTHVVAPVEQGAELAKLVVPTAIAIPTVTIHGRTLKATARVPPPVPTADKPIKCSGWRQRDDHQAVRVCE